MNKTEIIYEFSDITKFVKSIDLINNNYNIVSVIKKTNKKATYILEDKIKRLFFLKAKLKDFMSENELSVYKIIKKFPYDGVNKVIAIYQTKRFVLILTEYINGIHISDTNVWNDEHEDLIDFNLYEIFCKLIYSVCHLHSIGVLHCDIKPSNIILKIVDFKFVPILIDYDLSRTFDNNIINVCKFYGTIKFCSPEAKNGIIHKTTDVWNIALLFYLFIFRKEIGEENNKINNELIKKYDGKHKKIVTLLSDMLVETYTDRITIEELVQKIK